MGNLLLMADVGGRMKCIQQLLTGPAAARAPAQPCGQLFSSPQPRPYLGKFMLAKLFSLEVIGVV